MVAPTQAVKHDFNMGLSTRNFKLSCYLCFVHLLNELAVSVIMYLFIDVKWILSESE